MKTRQGFFCILALLSLSFPTLLSAQCMRGDCQNGVGTMIFENGIRYTGSFKNSKQHGRGTATFLNGNKYEGEWRSGSREGNGILTLADGSVYTGAFSKNRISGKGNMSYASGDRYEGQWDNDQPNGMGVYIFRTLEKYDGNFKNSDFDGYGTMYYPDRSRYEGQWKGSRRNGQGTYYLANGQYQRGNWVDNNLQGNSTTTSTAASNNTTTTIDESSLPDCNTVYCDNSQGKFMYGDGSKFVGAFRNGSPFGQGTCYYASGDIYVGNFENHAPQGSGTMYYRNGRKISALWEYGKPIGEMPSNQKPSNQTTTNTSTISNIDRDPEVKIWAIVVGVGRYTTMPVLKYSDDDAYQFYAFLKSPEGGALPDDRVRIMVDDDATKSNILQTMKSTFSRADENDVIVFYFSGHGIDGAFLPVNFDGFNNRLTHSEVKNILNESKAKHKLCIADACHSGSLLAARNSSMTEQLNQYYSAFNNSSGGLALLMSSKSEEYSLEDQSLRSGVFSHYLIKGLKGEADTDRNKIVTISELYNYLYQKVRSYTGNVQTPVLSGKHDPNMPAAVIRR